MKRKRLILWFIALLTIASAIVDLPQNFHLKFSVGPINIDRIIQSPRIVLDFGPISIRRDFSTILGLDLSGGTHLVLEAEVGKLSSEERELAFSAVRDIVERRVNLFGLTEPLVQQAKVGSSYRIIAEIPGVSDVSNAIDLIGQTAELKFMEEATDSISQATPSALVNIWTKETGLTGNNLRKSEVTFDPNTGKPVVSLEFDKEGTKLFADTTSRNIGKTIAIFLDNQLISAPQVRVPIDNGKAIIEGEFTVSQAKKLSIALNAGALPVPLRVIEQRNIGATLGQASIDKSIIAGAIGLLLIALFMIYTYGLFGLVANMALIIYIIIVFAVFKTLPVTLTLAGIAGFILSIGMAVDANILIFERMKEEMHWGRDFKNALDLGFKRAFPSIRDSNISSLITCAILYWFGTGIVRGFAIALAVGISVSLFSAITVTRTFLRMI